MAFKPRGCFDPRLSNHVAPRIKVPKPVKGKVRKKPVSQIRKLRDLPYREYLASKHWLNKRREALSHYGRKCNRCGKSYGLHVHHKTYKRIGCEKMVDLEVLCGGCHANHHEGKVAGVLDPMTREYLKIVS